MNAPFPTHVLNHVGHKSAGANLRLAAFLRSNRFTLGGAILVALILPELFHPLFAYQYPWARAVGPTEPELYAAGLALLCAHVGLRKVGVLPLVDDKVLILPVFLTTFSAT